MRHPFAVQSMPVLVLCAIVGAVGYVVGESRHESLREEVVRRGYATWTRHRESRAKVFVLVERDEHGHPSWDATFNEHPEYDRSLHMD